MALKPMRVNSNQVRRLLRQPIGSGFIAYRYSDDVVEVVEFVISPDGELTKTDGSPLEYICDDGRTVHYQIIGKL